jgi:uncharacterized protein YndB with AHSA1/START domain
LPQIKHAVVIAAPPERVARLALDPSSWPTWWVNLGVVEATDGPGGGGTTAQHRYEAGQFRASVTSCVLESQGDVTGHHLWYVAFDGALSGSQTLDLQPVGAWDEEPARVGTLVTATVDVAAEPGVDASHLEAHQDAGLRQTLQNLKSLVED